MVKRIRPSPTPMAQRVRSALVTLMILAPIFAPAATMADTVIQWLQKDAKAEKAYSIWGLKLRLIASPKRDPESLKLVAISPEGASITVYGAKDYLPLVATVLITHLDPLHSKVDVVFGVFSGGAHCCEKITVLSLTNRRWRTIDLGLWDGDSIPKPQTAQGKIALAFPDNNFLYAFASYAESAAPPKILRIENGRIIDASADPAFRSLNRENMIEARKLCAEGGNGGCAAYVASAARVGLFHQAWNFMLRHYDRQSHWQMAFCGTPGNGKCVHTVSFDDFPKALAWFLRKTGYLPPSGSGAPEAPARPFVPRTTMP